MNCGTKSIRVQSVHNALSSCYILFCYYGFHWECTRMTFEPRFPSQDVLFVWSPQPRGYFWRKPLKIGVLGTSHSLSLTKGIFVLKVVKLRKKGPTIRKLSLRKVMFSTNSSITKCIWSKTRAAHPVFVLLNGCWSTAAAWLHLDEPSNKEASQQLGQLRRKSN